MQPIDVSALPDFSISNQSPIWWGQALMAMIEGTLFLILIGIYFYARLSVDVWPPPGDQLPPLTAATIGLLPLALSTFASYWASEGAKEDSRRKMLAGLIANLLLAFVFLALQATAWLHLNFGWSTDIHGSIVWTILFLHTFDAVADLIFTFVLVVILLTGRYGIKQRIAVHVDSVLWYFIAAIWIPLYAVVFWGPRVLGAS